MNYIPRISNEFDELISLYGGKKLPAVGISFGIERLLDTVEEKLKLPVEAQVFVFGIGNTQKEALRIAQTLREKGAKVEMDLMNRGISKNLDYAGSKGIPFALIVGEKELKAGKVKLKNLQSGEEMLLELNEVFERLESK